MRVLVLGGAGFIAPHIMRWLREHGHHVTVLRRGSATLEIQEGVEVIVGDRNRLTESMVELRDARSDVVVDALAFTQAQAQNLMAAFTGNAKRVVVLSSGDVYRANDVLFRRIQSTDLDPRL